MNSNEKDYKRRDRHNMQTALNKAHTFVKNVLNIYKSTICRIKPKL